MRSRCVAYHKTLPWIFFLVFSLLLPLYAQEIELDPFEELNKEFLEGIEGEEEKKSLDPFEELNQEILPPEEELKILRQENEKLKNQLSKTQNENKDLKGILEDSLVRRQQEQKEEAESQQLTSKSRLSDKAIPVQVDKVPDRPVPLLELGNPFLGTGNLSFGIELPTEAVWQPSVLVYGSLRTAISSFHNPAIDRDVSEWANRLDIFVNLQLGGFGNERLVFGLQPFSKDGRFSGYQFEPEEEAIDEFSADVTALFFEGDLGEIFPFLNPEDDEPLDIGIAIGRQSLSFQGGVLINDTVDAVGIIRNNLLVPGFSNIRITGLFGWGQIDRGNNGALEDNSASVIGLLTSADMEIGDVSSSVDLDFVYIEAPDDTGDGFFGGLSAVQRLGPINTTFRINGSLAIDEQTVAVTNGVLFLAETSWTPTATDDNLYFNAFAAVDRYKSALRSVATGGPLGNVGILFAAVGLGRFPSPLDNTAERAVGAGLGYQMFWDDTRKQLIFEVGGRKETNNIRGPRGDRVRAGALAVGARYQQAIGQYLVLRTDTFVSLREETDSLYGGRIEFNLKF